MASAEAIKLEKKALRTELLRQRSLLSSQQYAEFSEQICQILLEYICTNHFHTVFAFWPQKFEVDLKALICNRDLKIFLPKITSIAGQMNFHRFQSESTLKENKYGIWEPRARSPIEIPSPQALMIIPALAVDQSGYRIGYGGGYYDRYLTNHKAKTVACIFDQFIMTSIPSDSYDVPVEGIVTQSKIKWYSA